MIKLVKKIIPLRDHIHVKVEQNEKTTPGGLHLPQDKDSSFSIGTVIEVGTGAITNDGTLIPMEIKKGDTILLGKWSGTKLGEDEYIVREKDILGRCIGE